MVLKPMDMTTADNASLKRRALAVVSLSSGPEVLPPLVVTVTADTNSSCMLQNCGGDSGGPCLPTCEQTVLVV